MLKKYSILLLPVKGEFYLKLITFNNNFLKYLLKLNTKPRRKSSRESLYCLLSSATKNPFLLGTPHSSALGQSWLSK